MSRIGRRPIPIPESIKVSVTNDRIKVEGPKGVFEQKIPSTIKITTDTTKKQLRIETAYNSTQDRIMHGTMRSLINNILIGVLKGHEKKLEINGVGYKAQLQDKNLLISLGFSHPVKIPVPDGLTITIPNPNLLIIQGVNKELVGNFAAKIRGIRTAEPYNLKGIKYLDEIIRRKAGKTFVSGTA
ncbi:MAG: 50S ribosomal protein L6 [Planctomycetota bacterium]